MSNFTGPALSGLTTRRPIPTTRTPIVTVPIINPTWSPIRSSPPGGTWTVNYKGTNQTFGVPDPQAASHVVIISDSHRFGRGILQSLTWVYHDGTTGSHARRTACLYEQHLGAEFMVRAWPANFHDSNHLTPATTSNTLTSTVSWSTVSGISMACDDSLGNRYAISFGGPAQRAMTGNSTGIRDVAA